MDGDKKKTEEEVKERNATMRLEEGEEVTRNRK